MTVVSHTNQVLGILTRKDLMGFAIEERLERLLTNPPRKLSRSVVLALRKNYGHKREHAKKLSTTSKDKKENGKTTPDPVASTSNANNKNENHADNHIV
jgi:hypothetical protein